MKIVILGATGQLGRQFCIILPGKAMALTHAQADLTKPAELRQTLLTLRPDVVINCAGYTQVDHAESERADAFAVNALGVRDLATHCRDLDCTLIHFSTDYVFGLDRLRTSTYTEIDTPGPINVYGESKVAGESSVRGICPKHFILRTCGLYASGQANFVTTMLRKAEEGSTLRVVADQICTPTCAVDLAHAALELLDSQAYGLYHVTNTGSCTWHEFATTIFQLAKKQVAVVPITSEEHGAPARRPPYSVLSNARWIEHGFTPMRSWQEALESYLHSSELDDHFPSP